MNFHGGLSSLVNGESLGQHVKKSELFSGILSDLLCFSWGMVGWEVGGPNECPAKKKTKPQPEGHV